jgi:hypothetical protein
MFRSRRNRRFRALYDALPADAKRQADSAYNLFKQNPRHPSLHFNPIAQTIHPCILFGSAAITVRSASLMVIQ